MPARKLLDCLWQIAMIFTLCDTISNSSSMMTEHRFLLLKKQGIGGSCEFCKKGLLTSSIWLNRKSVLVFANGYSIVLTKLKKHCGVSFQRWYYTRLQHVFLHTCIFRKRRKKVSSLLIISSAEKSNSFTNCQVIFT